MIEKERNELDEILTNDPLLACDVIDEKSNYQYTVKIIKWTGRFSEQAGNIRPQVRRVD